MQGWNRKADQNNIWKGVQFYNKYVSLSIKILLKVNTLHLSFDVLVCGYCEKKA